MPAATVCEEGLALREKSGAKTVKVTGDECVKLPLVPVIVRVYVPGVVFAAVVIERVDVEVAGFGAKLPLAPVGNPLTLNVTDPEKESSGWIVTP